MRLLALVKEPTSIARYLTAIGEPTEAPPRSPDRGPPYAFRIEALETSDSYALCHNELERSGTLDHAFDAGELAEAFPVRAWYHGRLEAVERPSR